MKSHRIRLLSASLALATAPFIGAALHTPALAQGSATVAVTSSDSIYGLAARLPKDTEGFLSFYHLSDLWQGFKDSNFLKKVRSNQELVKALDLDGLLREWERNAEMRKYVTMAASILGNEITIVTPAGFTENLAKILNQMPAIQTAIFTARASAGGEPGMPKAVLPLIEAVADMKVPPITFAVKAGGHRDDLNTLIAQGLSAIPPNAMSKIDRGKFTADGFSFESLSVKVDKAMPEGKKEEMKKELVRVTGNEEKGAALAGKLREKTAELTWGWVDDYLIVSIGSDHSHVRFASAADSVLTLPEVAPRAAQFAPKKPLAFSYTSQSSLKTLNDFGAFFRSLIPLAEAAKTAGAPMNVDNIITELKSLDTKATAIFPNNPDASVGAMWWEGGIRIEAYGGNKPLAYDNSKPLSLPGLASDKTLITIAGRSNAVFRDKVFGFLEDLAGSVWNIYQKDVKAIMPDDVRQGAAMGEMVALPMVKELWKSLQSFRAAMGNESAFFVNLDGAVPEVPNVPIPPEILSKGKLPRIAWMSELKDRAKLTESWNGLKTLISSAAAIAASQTRMNIPTEPTTKTEGPLEMYGYKLPIETGDVWPHTAVNATHWFLSTSPSFTKELAGKNPLPTGPACGARWNVNFNALWSFAADWVKLLPIAADPEVTEHVNFALGLLRSVGGFEVVLSEENGQSHDTFHFAIKDVE